MGGLLIRAYLAERRVDNLGRVVLMGTPNQGTEVVDQFRDKWWMKMMGPMANALGSDSNSFPSTLKPPYYPVGVIAGVRERGNNEHLIPGKDDGLVSVESTKLEGMSDFIVLETSHSGMRYNKSVAKQTVNFLRKGRFIR